MKKIMIIQILILLFFSSLFADEIILVNESANKLVINNFVEVSPLKEAGAMIGDVLISYDNTAVTSLKQLATLKGAVDSEIVPVTLIRNDIVITLETAKGSLGVYLREYQPDHIVLEDAVIIDGIGTLGWGLGMENSFLGCLTLLEEKIGNSLSYSDIIGLSAYGFRTHFFDCY